MEIDQLRYFLKIAELGSFTRAADALSVSQPAISRSIQKLEEELGQPVFERRSRSVALTDAGVLLQVRAQEALTLLEETKAELSDDGQTGRVRVGAIPTIAPYFLPSILKRFSSEFPHATAWVQENTTDNLLKSCKQGEIDLAILALPIDTKHLEYEVLFEEELFLVLPSRHPLLERSSIRPVDVQPYPFILLDEAHCLSDNIVSFCKQRSFQPISIERTSQLAMVLELVSLSHGVSLIPAMARERDTGRQREYRSFAGTKPTRSIAMIWNPYRFQSRLVLSFRDLLTRCS